ncbi:HAD superfamily hydrolase [Oxalicibacterium solurbis]|uniref:HAD superfamily hydrolase n=2 Tax=Oxalicibacterium solurbis TaxID=69280 RepID=A0A8J3F656_9BURK|nr:HAD superfamily hydrolase [Oxalicibacterium solurbis]
MVIIFDLDDTLYNERTYVEGGIRAVATFGEEKFGWNGETSFRFMMDELDARGRGAIFNQWLWSHDKFSKALVERCVQVYRQHIPILEPDEEALKLLSAISKYPKYIVTDGHKIVQRNKIMALDLNHFFRKIFITHRYGLQHAKPSIYCFEKIKKMEACNWHDMFYVGDNPSKDFVNLNPLGVRTVRVLTGVHRDVNAKPGYDALHTIESLKLFPKLLEHKS